MAGEPIGGSGLMAGFRLETERLILREWRDDDFGALRALRTDAKVMATIGPLQDEQRTRDMLARLQMRQARDGCTFWAMERKEDERVFAYECSYGSFTRSFTLPEGIDADHVDADLRDGVMTIRVPKLPETQPRKIALRAGEKPGDKTKAKA